MNISRISFAARSQVDIVVAKPLRSRKQHLAGQAHPRTTRIYGQR